MWLTTFKALDSSALRKCYIPYILDQPREVRQIRSPGYTWLMAPPLVTTDQPFEDSEKFHSPARGLQGLAYS